MPSTTSADAAARLLTDADCVLFDFDGPLCRLFAGPPGAAGIAAELRRPLTGQLLDSVATIDDPHEVYRRTSRALRRPGQPEDHRVTGMRKRLDELEIAAAGTAEPAPGAAELLRLLSGLRKPLAVVSNNCEAAVRAYLDRADLAHYFTGPVIGRDDDSALMKPDPAPVRRALEGLGAAPGRCLLIGDSLADAEAAAAAGMPFLGCHHDSGKRRLLGAVRGVRHVVAELAVLVALLRA
ncbi:HAD family hydrolase [Streptomyces boninensis]|uniref:HAD family hydrolase n=1 Tax=Streptomyces boninensis TaxID=2039455 RepID=UPI003B224A57